MSEISFLGQTNFRGQEKKFGIKSDDRRRHIYVVGKTGMGKTTLLENMIIADMNAGRGVGVVDPHGELAEKILDFVPEDRVNDVVYFNPADMAFPIAFNPLEQVGTEYRHLVASGIMAVFKKIWPDVWSARMEYILNNSLLALLEYPGSTLLGIMRILSDKAYRQTVVENLKDPVVKSFWVNEFAKYTQRLESEATAAIQNKVGQFVTNPLIRNILGQPHSSINMRDVMDKKKILIVNLSKGRIGEDNSSLLGAMIITKLQLAAMSRIEVPEAQRIDFNLYVDEFQNFATDSFAMILSEARKYRLDLILAHQYLGQLETDGSSRVQDAIFGNVGTMISFRVGAEDGEFLEKEFQPDFMMNDFVNLPKYNFYIKLMIDGVASRPFSAQTIAPMPVPEENFKNMLIEASRKNYGTPQEVVEKKIASEWVGEGGKVMNDRLSHQGEQSLSKVLGAPAENRSSEEKDFVPHEPRRPERERKEVDISDLRRTLEEALGKSIKDEDDEATGKEGKPEQ
ncbi:MAG: type IV secretion system DNA-binding domain-containing protein [Candidatus Pacebacteria bacterium]|nr:type IV secretion system DNA-binding domain-containing protein [Candidatus Paceibacterota bacterium]